MNIVLKKCKEETCYNQFPNHYFHDYCPAHTNTLDDGNAQKICNKLYNKRGENGLLINAMSSCAPLSPVVQNLLMENA